MYTNQKILTEWIRKNITTLYTTFTILVRLILKYFILYSALLNGNIFNRMKVKTQYIKLWNAAKTVLRRKFLALNVYIGKKERCN